LSNTYNYLPSSSPLRAFTLLALLVILARSSELASLPLTPAFLTSALSQWSIPQSEKIAFLTRASAIHQSAEQLPRALELAVLALQHGSVEKPTAEKAVVLALSVRDNLSLDEVLEVQGVRSALDGKMAELVKLFTEVDEVEAVGKGNEWAAANASWVEAFGESASDGLSTSSLTGT
jgi:hypothetical protein